jgi:hypothetical protein
MIIEAGRAFVALRKDRPAFPVGRGPTYHAVTPHCRAALCATEPGAGSAWSEPPAGFVTCRACLRRLARLRATNLRRQA